MDVKTDVDGMADEINDLLLQYETYSETAMREAIEEVSRRVQKNVKISAKTLFNGKESYPGSWTRKKEDGGYGKYKVIVYPKKYHWLSHLLENGHKVANGHGKWNTKWKGKGFVDPKPHIAISVNDIEPELVEILKEKLEGV